jgi:aminomethyltransferase
MAKKTAFYDMHVQHKGRIVEFAGYLMPIQFQGIVAEHLKVRSSVGVFDVSHMGEVIVTGKDALKFTNYITTNDVSQLALNQVQYSTMLYPDGGIVDDLLVYRLADRYFLVINAANTNKDVDWIVKNKRWDVDIKNVSDEIAQLAIQGPKAEPVVQKLVTIPLGSIKYYWACETKIGGFDVILSRTGYTGEDGFEIYTKNENGPKLWDMTFAAGQEFGIEPIGLGARDTLRLEMKMALYGNDIDQTTNPLEAGLGWVVKLDKDNFIGKDALAKIKAEGMKRRLVAFESRGKGIPRPHFAITKDGRELGYVTSGTFSPSLKKGIGLGYVDIPAHEPGSILAVKGKPETFDVEVIKPPFYKNASHK